MIRKNKPAKAQNLEKILKLKRELQNKMDEVHSEIKNLQADFEKKKSKSLLQKIRDSFFS